MALIKCPECGKEISDQVRSCPHCGYPIKKGASASRIGLIALLCAAVIGGGYFAYHQKVVVPKRNYEKAVNLFEQGNYDVAEAMFQELGSYGDAEEYLGKIANERIYEDAVAAFEKGDYDRAEELFGQISDYSDAADYLENISNERIYQEACALYEAKEYTAAKELFAQIPEYSDVSDIVAKIDGDIAYNEGIDTLNEYGFYAQSVEQLGCGLLDDVTQIWYNSIYEKSSYATDEYTRDENGEFYEDFNTALSKYFQSDEYARVAEQITSGQKTVDGLYASVKALPDSLSECREKALAVHTAYTGLVNFALDITGNLNSVNEEARTRHNAFETAYTEYKLVIPEKLGIDPSVEETYDFRHMNFGMNVDEVMASEEEYYGLTDDYSYGSFVTYGDVELDDGMTGEVVYVMNDYRIVDSAWINFEAGTSEEQITDLLKKWYGENFDEKGFIALTNKQYPYFSFRIDADETATTLYLNPLSQEEYEQRYSRAEAAAAEAETEIFSAETEAETEAAGAAFTAETEAETEAVGAAYTAETEAETEAAGAAYTAETEAETEAAGAAYSAETEAEIAEAATEAEIAEVATEAEEVLTEAEEVSVETELIEAATEAEIVEVATEAEIAEAATEAEIAEAVTEAEIAEAATEAEAAEEVLTEAEEVPAETEVELATAETEAEIAEAVTEAEIAEAVTEAEVVEEALTEAEEVITETEAELAEETMPETETEAETEIETEVKTTAETLEEAVMAVEAAIIEAAGGSIGTETPETLQTMLSLAEDTVAQEAGEADAAQGVMSYADYVAAQDDDPVTIEAYVQAKQAWYEGNTDVGTDTATLYLQDEDGAYFAYAVPCSAEVYEQLKEGTKVRITGYKETWSGEVEIVADEDLTPVEIIDGEFVAEAADITDLLADEEALAGHMNQKVCFTGMTIEAAAAGDETESEEGEEAPAFLYNWDGSGQEGDDLYFNASKDGVVYTFVVESYLCGPDTDVYQAVRELKVGDTVDLEGFLYWYEGAQPHITSVSPVG